LGSICDFAALGFGSQIIVGPLLFLFGISQFFMFILSAPLGSLTLVSNILLAPMLLKEKITREDVYATLTIVAGCAVSVAFASHKDCLYSEDQLFSFYTTSRFKWFNCLIFTLSPANFLDRYISIVLVVLVVWLLTIRGIENTQRKFGNESPEYMRFFKIHRFSYASISGIIGAQVCAL
jgi:hypothetical protein